MYRRTIKYSAKIYAANVIRQAIGLSAGLNTNTPIEDTEVFIQELHKIATELSPIWASEIDECLKIAIELENNKKAR